MLCLIIWLVKQLLVKLGLTKACSDGMICNRVSGYRDESR